MAVAFKAQAFFNSDEETDVRPAGWSETYWIVTDNASTALGFLTTLVTDRLDMLPATVSLVYRRISAYPSTRAVYINAAQAHGSYASAPGITEPSVAALVRIQEVGGFFTLMYLHGIPTDCITTSGDFTPTTPYNTAFTAWMNQLHTNWSLRRRNHTPPPPSNFFSIDTAAIQRLVTRRVGRPFATRRGRRMIA